MRTISTTILLLALFASGCGDEGKPAAGAGPSPREGDPELLHTWTMPAQEPGHSSALASGDLGSSPPELAAALMEGGRMPSIAHRIAQHCARQNALKGADMVVLRFSTPTTTDVVPDPPGAAGTCMADALRQEIAEVGELPAGAALLRIRLRAGPT